MQAWEALQRGQFAQAEALYEKVEHAEPQNVDALLGLAAIAVQRGNSELATRHYSRALELEPRNATAQAALISLLGQADPQMSESRLKQLIAREPSANLVLRPGQPVRAQARSGRKPSRPTSRPTSCIRTTRTTPTTSRWVSST